MRSKKSVVNLEMQTVGSKAMVFHGTAKHTSGGLEKKNLVKNKHGRIVSLKKMKAGRKALKFLTAAGFKAKKGTFKLFRKGAAKKSARKTGKSKRFF